MPLFLLLLALSLHAAGFEHASYGKADAPLIVMVHRFPDFWYTWRDQRQVLGDAGYRCVALNLRGYNLSGQPEGIENYDMRLLVGDVVSVIKANGREKAIAWQVAFNLPHPRGLSRELANNPDQQKASEYARLFQEPDSHLKLTPKVLANWVKDPEALKLYVEAFYQRNYPRPPYMQSTDPRRLAMPVLLIHGLKDTALLSPALNGTWDWLDDLTLVTIPEAGHFVQQDATQKVSRSVKS